MNTAGFGDGSAAGTLGGEISGFRDYGGNHHDWAAALESAGTGQRGVAGSSATGRIETSELVIGSWTTSLQDGRRD